MTLSTGSAEKEINKQVAEKIFGKELWLCKYPPKSDKYIKADFCGDISDAWKVVEKMEYSGYQWKFSRTDDIKSYHDNLPAARFWTYNKGKLCNFGRECAASLPMAICLAALKAVEKS